MVAGAGAVGYWLYGDRLPSEIARAASTAASKARDAADAATATRPASPPSAPGNPAGRDARAIAWANVVDPGTPTPNVAAALAKHNGEWRLNIAGEPMGIHAAAQKYLGTEPPNHASQWWRTGGGKTLFQIWQDQQAAEF